VSHAGTSDIGPSACSERPWRVDEDDYRGTEWESRETAVRKRLDYLCRLPCFDGATIVELNNVVRSSRRDNTTCLSLIGPDVRTRADKVTPEFTSE